MADDDSLAEYWADLQPEAICTTLIVKMKTEKREKKTSNITFSVQFDRLQLLPC